MLKCDSIRDLFKTLPSTKNIHTLGYQLRLLSLCRQPMAMHSSVTHTDPSAPTPQEPFPILASRHQLAEVPCVARIRKPDLAAPSFPSVHQEQGKWHLQELLQGTAGLTSGKVSGESASPSHSSTQRDHRGFWVSGSPGGEEPQGRLETPMEGRQGWWGNAPGPTVSSQECWPSSDPGWEASLGPTAGQPAAPHPEGSSTC